MKTTHRQPIRRAIAIALLSAAAALPVLSATERPPAQDGGLAALAFLEGDWCSDGALLADALGDAAGPFDGTTVCAYGGGGTWMTCDFETPELGELGHYAIHTVFWKARGGGYEGFVVNNYGTAAYRSVEAAPGRLVFHGGRPGGEQRITYEALDDGRVRFYVELTRDGGETYLLHTDAVWTRRGGR